MKKLLLSLVCVLFVLSLCGCSKYYNYNYNKYLDLGDVNIENMPELKTVTDEDVILSMKSALTSFGEEKVVLDKAGEYGDYVTINAKCFDAETGEAVEELNKTNITVRLGFDYVTEGFTNQLKGHKTGEKFSFEIKLDSDFESLSLSGILVRYDCEILEMLAIIYPEFTDEFIKENTDFETYQEFYDATKAQLIAQYKTDYDENRIDAVWNSITAGTNIKEIPEKEKNLYIETIKEAYKDYAEENNSTLSDYLKNNLDMTEEEFEEFAIKNAEDTVKQDLIVNATAEKYGIKLTNKEYKAYLESQMTNFGFDTPDDFEEYYGELILRQLALEAKVSEYFLNYYK